MTKKTLTSLLLLCIGLLFVTACSPEAAEEPTPVQETETVAEVEPTVPPTPTSVPTLPPPVISGNTDDGGEEESVSLPEPAVAEK